MPWPNLLYNQTDLARLCINWDVQPLEYHVHNPMHGFDQLLRVYAALPNEPLPWTMEHFLSLGDPPPNTSRNACRRPASIYRLRQVVPGLQLVELLGVFLAVSNRTELLELVAGEMRI